MKIKKGDKVKIMSGKDRGKSGAVIRALLKKAKVTVEGVNLYKKRIKPRRTGEKGETVLVARPVSVSNVMILCSNCNNPARIGYRFESDQKIRYCKKCGSKI